MMRFRLATLSLVLFTGLVLWATPGNAQFYGNAQQNSASLQASQGEPQNVLIILDASDSMNERMGHQTKMEAAKQVVLKTIRSLPPNVNVGLRVYGHKTGNLGMIYTPFGGFTTGGEACRQSELKVPISANNRAQIATQIMDINAVGKTPITYSLTEAIRRDFSGVRGKKTIILISDGRETCAANPCDVAVDMVRAGIDIKINTVGFGTHDKFADNQLRCVALSTKGKFYSTNTMAELERSLQDTMQVQTNINAKILPGP